MEEVTLIFLKPMKYPILPQFLWKRRKMTNRLVLKAKTLRKKGLSYQKIADKIKVSKKAIIYNLNEKVRQKNIKYSKKRNHELWKNYDYRKYNNKKKAVLIKERKDKDPTYKKWIQEYERQRIRFRK